MIVILGYMGSGKSLIGKALAKKLMIDFVDLDAYIEAQESQSIATIFKTKGELGFRKLEFQKLQNLINANKKIVLALGGGTPCYFDSIRHLNTQPQIKTIYLKSALPTLVERLWLERDHRPMIAHLQSKIDLTEFIGKHLFERQSFYNQAKFSVNTTHKKVVDIVTEIEALLG